MLPLQNPISLHNLEKPEGVPNVDQLALINADSFQFPHLRNQYGEKIGIQKWHAVQLYVGNEICKIVNADACIIGLV